MKYLSLYLIDGFPALVITRRPFNAFHMRERIYHNPTGETVTRIMMHKDTKIRFIQDKGTGTQFNIAEMRVSI